MFHFQFFWIKNCFGNISSLTQEHYFFLPLLKLEVEHIYYRHDFIAKAVDRASKFDQTFGVVSMLHPACISSSATQMKKFDATKIHPGSCGGKPQIAEDSVQPDTEQRITDLCTFVYQYGSDRSRTRAMLCHIFFIALHDKFLEARDLLLMSKLQDTIGNAVADVPTMILFNRYVTRAFLLLLFTLPVAFN